jgi:hypothetical protein
MLDDDMSDLAFDVRVTDEAAWPVAQRVIAALYDDLDAVMRIRPKHRQRVIQALATAFSEGSKFATAEVLAQLIENGLDVRV